MGTAATLIFATACGLAVGNIYYAQPLLDTLARAFGVDEAIAGLIVTITQLGYATGLLLIVPLGDLIENRRLILTVMSGTVGASVLAAYAPGFAAFAFASLALGITSVVAQILIPLAAHLTPAERRGRVVGQIMSGLLTGILLARSAAGIVSGTWGWRTVYVMSAALMALAVAVLARVLPRRRPEFPAGYGGLMVSLARIYGHEPVLRRRALYQAAMFAAFSTFWTSVTFRLVGAPFHLTQTQIGLFALAGAASAFCAPYAGRLADAGHSRIVTGGAFIAAAATFALMLVPALWALVVAAIVLDVAVQTTMILGQRAIYGLDPAARSRINTLYMTTVFVGGAAGSAISSVLDARAGWNGVVAFGIALALAVTLAWLREPPPERAASAPA